MSRLRVWILALALGLVIIAYPAAAASVSSTDIGFADDYVTSPNMQPVGSSPRLTGDSESFNTDLAFWNTLAVQGTFEGFRLVDISDPSSPEELADYDDCAPGTTDAGKGDVVVWGNLVARSWHAPAGEDGSSCGDVAVPAGAAGVHVFDISNPSQPEAVAFVPTSCGSHSLTAVPDTANGQLLVYSGATAPTLTEGCRGMDILSVPIAEPAEASHVRFVSSAHPGATLEQSRTCEDVTVHLGREPRAVCAGGDGYTLWSLDESEGGSLDDPAIIYSRPIPSVSTGHSAAFTWDGEVLVFAHSPGSGVQGRCQETSNELDRTLFFFDPATGEELGRFVLPRLQAADENCTWNRFNVVPTDKGYLLVAGNYQSGISVVDFTDPKYAAEIAYADPAPLPDGQVGGDWAAYWYNGHIYESNMTRGLHVWQVRGEVLTGTAKRLPRLNPQTIETFLQQRSVYDTRPTGSFRLVGHDRLLQRGMNAAMAIHGDYAYIGSRTDGDEENSNNAGILVVDISDPTSPSVVNQVGPPWAAQAGESARELRVWQSQDILIVLNTNCSAGLHHCLRSSQNSIRFFDISDPENPELILQHNRNTHEFYLWEDPNDPERALMVAGSAGTSGTGSNTALTIWDISPVKDGEQPTILYAGTHGYSNVAGVAPNGGLHSLSVSNDGAEAYFALLTGGFAVADISDFTAGRPDPERRPVTLNENRPTWPGPGAHSALKLWGRDWVYASDEVYGTAAASGHGCPWGWGRMIDISDRTHPTVEAEYRVEQNFPWLCHRWEPRARTSYSAHNPTHTPNLVFTSWHSNGFQAISVEDPTNPYQVAVYEPRPLRMVQTEDPMLSSDVDTDNGEKVVMWSYPIIKDGLIYIVDLRNGLYILEYEGVHADEVADVTFLEGNSNLGHALCFDPVLKRKENPDDPDEYLIPDYC